MRDERILLTIHPEMGCLSIKEIYGKLTLEDLQEAVGGYIQPCAPVELVDMNIQMLVDEEGLLKGLPPNLNMVPFFYVGNCVFVGVKGADFVPLTYDEALWVCEWIQNLGVIDC